VGRAFILRRAVFPHGALHLSAQQSTLMTDQTKMLRLVIELPSPFEIRDDNPDPRMETIRLLFRSKKVQNAISDHASACIRSARGAGYSPSMTVICRSPVPVAG
jgi:hypothetical protein